MFINRLFYLLIAGLVLASLILTACARPTPAPSNFPTGKFIKSGATNYGLVFNEDETFIELKQTTRTVKELQ